MQWLRTAERVQVLVARLGPLAAVKKIVILQSIIGLIYPESSKINTQSGVSRRPVGVDDITFFPGFHSLWTILSFFSELYRKARRALR